MAFAIAGPPPFFVLALNPPFWVVIVTYAVAGFASGVINPMIGAILFERIPRPLVGRVAALTDAIAWAAMPLGALIAPVLILLAGLSGAFAIAVWRTRSPPWCPHSRPARPSTARPRSTSRR